MVPQPLSAKEWTLCALSFGIVGFASLFLVYALLLLIIAAV